MNLDIGGQKHRRDLEGLWKIVDVSPNADIIHDLNSSKLLPFNNNSINNIYTSHTLEHIEPVYLAFILNEFYRILVVGGKCRIVVPDCLYAIKLYMKNPKELANKKYCGKPDFIPATKMGCLTSWFHTNKNNSHAGHKIGFDAELLRAFIGGTQFTKIDEMSYNNCSKIFRGKDYERYAKWSLYFELTKEK